MADLPLEYFLPLPQTNTDGEIIGERTLSPEIAQALDALRISEELLAELRARHLQGLRLQHKELLTRYKRTKNKVQACLRKARSRQTVYPDNVEKQQKRLDKLKGHIGLRTKAYQTQEQQAQGWFPLYYNDGRFNAGALGLTLRRYLPGLIPSFVEEVAWSDQNGKFHPSPSTPKLSPEELKQNPIFRDLATHLYEALLYWCPRQRREAKVFAERLSPLHHAWKVGYNTQAEELTVAVLKHAVPTLRYTPSDLRYLIPPVKLSMEQRLPEPPSEQQPHIPTNEPSEDLKKIRQNAYQKSLFDPFGL